MLAPELKSSQRHPPSPKEVRAMEVKIEFFIESNSDNANSDDDVGDARVLHRDLCFLPPSSFEPSKFSYYVMLHFVVLKKSVLQRNQRNVIHANAFVYLTKVVTCPS